MKMKKYNNFPLANFLFNFLITMVPYSCLGQNSRQDYINVHNAARAKVGVGPIMWSEKVANFARNYARQRVGDCNLIHSTNRPYGENLAKGGEDLTGSAAVDFWVNERPNYVHTSNSCIGGQCLHYTQVVWRNSTHVGCARVRCNDGWWFISCNYDPPGNYIGQRPY